MTQLQTLLDKYQLHAITAGEREELFQLLQQPGKIAELEAFMDAQFSNGDFDIPENEALRNLLFERIQEQKQQVTPVRKINWYKRIAAAASVLLVISMGAYMLLKQTNKKGHAPLTAEIDIPAPDKTKASITLADGRIIYLDSLNSDTVSTAGNVTVLKTADGKIIYKSEEAAIAVLQYNTLNNPRGSKVIDMLLSDGSHVWLNAGSSITYPVVFNGSERKVTISGEAYFEVAHDKMKPFLVDVNNKGMINVLGTHFNVSAYKDEAEIKITLLEGSVAVSAQSTGIKLIPGQQALLTENNTPSIVNGVDLDAVMAWQRGLFEFNNISLPVLLRQLSRWYDIEVDYKAVPLNIKLGGGLSRTQPLSNVLKMLEANGIKMKLEDNVLKIVQ